MTTNTSVKCMWLAAAVMLLSLLAGGDAPGAVLTAPVQSLDKIIGANQANAPALGYYADTTSNPGLIGVTGSGSSQTRANQNTVLGFQLPALPAGHSIVSVTLNYEITANRDHNNDDHSLDVYLLDTANPDVTGTSLYYHGPSDPSGSVEFVDSTYIPVGTISVGYPDDQEDQAYALTGDALTLLQSFYGGDETPDQAEAFFRFNFDIDPGYGTTVPGSGSVYQQYRVDTAADESWLAIETTGPAVPEPMSLAVGLFGMTMLVARRRRRA